jgi:DNA-binding NarL/FixJ family response regulator
MLIVVALVGVQLARLPRVTAESAGRRSCQGWPEATAERLSLDGEKPCGHFPGSEEEPVCPVGHYRCDGTCPADRCQSSAWDQVELQQHDLPDGAVVVLDLNLPGLRGPAAVRFVRTQGPAVLVLSASEAPTDVLEAVHAGAAGYLSKQVEEQELLTAIRAVAGGRTYVSPVLASYLLQAPICLTPRERGILELVTEGETDQDIADLLVISIHTIHSHLDRIRQKTGRHRRGELAGLAIDQDDGRA